MMQAFNTHLELIDVLQTNNELKFCIKIYSNHTSVWMVNARGTKVCGSLIKLASAHAAYDYILFRLGYLRSNYFVKNCLYVVPGMPSKQYYILTNSIPNELNEVKRWFTLEYGGGWII